MVETSYRYEDSKQTEDIHDLVCRVGHLWSRGLQQGRQRGDTAVNQEVGHCPKIQKPRGFDLSFMTRYLKKTRTFGTACLSKPSSCIKDM